VRRRRPCDAREGSRREARVVIQYRRENLRIVAVLGPNARLREVVGKIVRLLPGLHSRTEATDPVDADAHGASRRAGGTDTCRHLEIAWRACRCDRQHPRR
jgi:hypothetical protein